MSYLEHFNVLLERFELELYAVKKNLTLFARKETVLNTEKNNLEKRVIFLTFNPRVIPAMSYTLFLRRLRVSRSRPLSMPNLIYNEGKTHN